MKETEVLSEVKRALILNGNTLQAAQVGAAIAAVCDAEVLRCQVDSLRDALAKVLDTREAEAKANLAYEVALKNYSDPRPDNRRHLETMTKASNAEKDARLLLATLKPPNAF